MGGKMSLNKGKRAEREVVKLLQPIVDRTYKAYPVLGEPPRLQRNTLQSDVGGFDIVGLEWLALEVKFQETLQINQWWRQAARQAAVNQEAVLIYRQSYKPWRVVMKMHKALPQDKTFFCTCDIKIDDFLVFFESRMFYDLRAKAATLEAYSHLDGFRGI